MKIESNQIKARTNKLNAKWTIEASQDLQSMHGGGLGDNVEITVRSDETEIGIVFEVKIDDDRIEAHTLIGKKTKRLEDYTKNQIDKTIYEKDEARLLWDILVDSYHCVLSSKGSTIHEEMTLEKQLMDVMAKEIAKEISKEIDKGIWEAMQKNQNNIYSKEK